MSLELLYESIIVNRQLGKVNLQNVQLDTLIKYQEVTKSGFIYLY
jgi:hypothetical protein